MKIERHRYLKIGKTQTRRRRSGTISAMLLSGVVLAGGPANAKQSSLSPARTSDVAQVQVDQVQVDSAGGAQQARQEGEILVTGVRFRDNSSAGSAKIDLPLVETPQPITIISSQVIQSIGARQLTDLAEYVPGVSGFTASYGEKPNFTIRGYGVDTYLDGYLLVGNMSIDPVLVERVEFVKGANSISYGPVSPGGFVNIISKQPARKTTFAAQVGIGTFGYKRGQADFGGPLNDDATMRVRVGGAYEESAKDFRGQDRRKVTLFGSAAFDLSETTTLTVNGLYSDAKAKISYGLPILDEGLGPDLTINERFPRRFFPGQDWNRVENTINRASAVLTQKLGSRWTLSAYLARTFTQEQYKADYICCGDTNAAQIATINGANPQRVINAEVRAQGKVSLFGRDHDVAIFAEHRWQKGGERNFVAPLLDDDANVFNLQQFPDPFAASLQRESTVDGSSRLFGIAFNARLNIADPVKILLGGRYDKLTSRGTFTTYDTATGNATVENQDPISESRFTPRVAVVINPVRKLNFYYSYSESFVPGSGQTCPYDGNGNSITRQNLSPQITKQHELGGKYELNGGRLLVSAAAFRLEQTGESITDPNCRTPQGVLFLASIGNGKSRSQGLELEMVGNITNTINVIAGYSYTDANALVRDPGFAVGVGQPNTPTHTASLYLRYDFPKQNPLTGFGLGAGASYESSRPSDGEGTFALPGGTTFDAGIFYRHRSGLNASLNVNNIFDKRLYDSSFGLSIFGIQERPPRTVELSVGYNF